MREKLGDVRYWYQRDGRRIAKMVTFFLLDYVSGEADDHDHEVEDARWMPLEEAARCADLHGRARHGRARAVAARPSG